MPHEDVIQVGISAEARAPTHHPFASRPRTLEDGAHSPSGRSPADEDACAGRAPVVGWYRVERRRTGG
jgi:hypothetical protein